MSRDFLEVDRETAWLLPPSVQDWLPEDHRRGLWSRLSTVSILAD